MKNDLIGLSTSLLLHGALALALFVSGPLLPPAADRAVPLTIAMFEAEPEEPAREPPPAPAARAPERPVVRKPPERPRAATMPPAPRVELEPAPAPTPTPLPEASQVPEPEIATREPEPEIATPDRAPASATETAVQDLESTPPTETAYAPAAERQAVAGYAQLLAALIAQHRAYPRLAQLRRMQGMVEVRMRVGPGGRLIDTAISRSSGYEVLDRQALEMVRLVRPLPEPPEPLQDREFTVSVPVAFRLEG